LPDCAVGVPLMLTLLPELPLKATPAGNTGCGQLVLQPDGYVMDHE
jgi:hypothetical protein